VRVLLYRHGRTAWNDQGRYQGRTDVPLSPQGMEELAPAPFSVQRVYVSPLTRARQTAARFFPGAELIPVPGFTEFDFGTFEGRTWREMESDPDYRAWVEGGCEGRCPGGEDLPGFRARTLAAFLPLMKGEDLTVVAHSGTLMAILEAFALPERRYFDWLTPCGGGYELDGSLWREKRKLTLVRTLGGVEP